MCVITFHSCHSVHPHMVLGDWIVRKDDEADFAHQIEKNMS